MELTREERAKFKAMLAEQGRTIREFCERYKLNYGTFRAALCGNQPMVPLGTRMVLYELGVAGKIPFNKDDTAIMGDHKARANKRTTFTNTVSCSNGMVLIVVQKDARFDTDEIPRAVKEIAKRAAQNVADVLIRSDRPKGSVESEMEEEGKSGEERDEE